MGKFIKRVILRSFVGVAMLTGPATSHGTGGQGRPASREAFLTIKRLYLPLPAGMQPWYPTFLPDGRTILFQNLADRTAWTIAVDGTGLHCVNCGFADTPNTRGGFAYAFPDGRRLLFTHGVGRAVDSGPDTDGWVLECAPSIFDCATHRYLPVDMGADRGPFPLAQRRTWHLAPDGVHLGWMEVRSDGTLMVVARLERQADKYIAADPRVVNPSGPTSASDTDPDRWENLSQLYELKSFTPDGRAVLAVGTPNNNVDIVRIELADGRVTRLTTHPDWDEDSSLSPDQQLLVVAGWRGRHRLEPLAWIPQIRGFMGLMTGAAIAPYYVSTWEGFQCDISPWLLPADGDRGHLMGQPVDIYDKDLTAAAHQQGQQNWSPDSTMLILQERTRNKEVRAPNRIAIARLGRAPTVPVPFVSSAVGDWAVPAKLYRGPLAEERTAIVRGRKGGRATIQYKGRLGTSSSISVAFDRFTDDGATFVSGTMSGASENKGSGENRPWRLLSDIVVTGRHTGSLKMDLYIDNSTKPLPTKRGTIAAVYDGKIAPPLPPLAPCYDAQPKASPLIARAKRFGRSVRVSVMADILGDTRPVAGAEVRYGIAIATTDARGRAVLPVTGAATRELKIAAGDTFVPASVVVR